MSIPEEQVIEVRAHRSDGRDTVGSGFLLSERLALTAAHVVFAKSGSPLSPVLIRPGKRKELVKAKVIWPARRGVADAALVQITDRAWKPPERVRTVHWGKITGSAAEIPCAAIGFPRVRRESDIGRDAEHLSGCINPGNRLRGRRYDIDIRSTPPAPGNSPWAGMSGAALFSGDLLIGVIIIDTPGYGEGRLTAEPVFRLAADATFVASVAGSSGSLELESVELGRMFTPPRRQSSSHSRARLLDATAEVVPFRGREEILEELRAWCETSDDFTAKLIIGPGGQGKSRLARELCRGMRQAGWVAGTVHDTIPEGVVNQLTDTSEPVLLVVDVAETRTGQITDLVEAAWRRPDGAQAIRLLMIARSDGDWWEQLRRRLPDPLRSVSCTKLSALEDDVSGRLDAYHDALRAFAEHLNEAEPEVGWLRIMSGLAQPDMENATFGSVLTLHMTALTMLLQAGHDPIEMSQGERPEDVLLDHEMQYWAGSRINHPTEVLCRAIAAATLCGAEDEHEALTLLDRLKRLRDMNRGEQAALVDWIGRLYPVPSGRVWGYLQPDRLGEHLIRRVASSESDFLDDVTAGATAHQLQRAVAVVARIGGRLHEEGALAEARQWYQRAATAGHKDAAYKLGELLCKDDKTAEARQWYQRAATAGHNDAAYKLGELLCKDDKTAEAKKWYIRAAAAEHLNAAYELGSLLETEGDHLGAMYWWRTAAKDRADAAYQLAELLMQDHQRAEAMQWYEQAADRQYHVAAFKLGELLWQDDRPGEAIRWYDQAAKGGHAYAAYQLGWLLLNTQSDQEGAAYWWRMAAERGEEKARPLNLAELLWREGKPSEAKRWYDQAAREGNAYAAYQLGSLLKAEGDHLGAMPWWRIAAAERADAAYQLAELLMQDHQRAEAMQWYEQAADRQHHDAAFRLGELLWHDERPNEALRWYDQAAKGGHAYAAYRLGCLLQTQGDHQGATYWWRIAAERGEEEAKDLINEQLQ